MMTNLELRQRMRGVIKPNLQVLLVIALIAALPGLVASTVSTLMGSDLATYLYERLDTSATAERLLEEMQAFYLERGWIATVMSILQALVSPVLTLGMIYAILTLMRGGTAVVATVFSRLHAVVRSVLLFLLVMVKIMLWMLPGMALMILSAFLGETVMLAMMSIGPLLMIIPGIMANYRYAMANFFLADEPETGVLSCVRQSKAVMQNRKLQLFSLELPYMLGSTLVGALISTLLGGVIGATISMMVQLIFTVYLYGARCAFFEAYSRPDGGMAHAFRADPYHDDSEMKE